MKQRGSGDLEYGGPAALRPCEACEIVALDREGAIVYLTGGFADWASLPVEGLLGMQFTDIRKIGPDDEERWGRFSVDPDANEITFRSTLWKETQRQRDVEIRHIRIEDPTLPFNGIYLIRDTSELTIAMDEAFLGNALLNASDVSTCAFGAETYRLCAMNDRFFESFGQRLNASTRDELIGMPFFEIWQDTARCSIEKLAGDYLDSVVESEAVEFSLRSDGTDRPSYYNATLKRVSLPNREPLILFTATDTTVQEEQKRFVEMLLNRNPAVIMSQGRDWKIQSCSDAWTRQFGYSRDETVGRDLTEFMPPEDAAQSKIFREGVLQSKYGPHISKNVLTIMTKAGEPRSVELQSIVERDNGEWRNIIAMVDITQIMRAGDELLHLVENDELTDLMSRRGLKRRFADGRRKNDLGFFLIDIDYFKSVNDAYGHEAGDDLLQAISETLKKLTAIVGCPVRLGGEEFAVFRPWNGWSEAHDFAEKVRGSLRETSINFQGTLIQRSASIGFIEVKTEDELQTAMHLADLAQREAKTLGRDKCVPADADLLRKLEERGAFIKSDQVQAALETGEFYYEVQPIVHVGTGREIGFEALIRWRNPVGDIIKPERFIETLYEVLRQPHLSSFKDRLRGDVLKKLTGFDGRYVAFNFILEEIAYRGAAEKIDIAFRAAIGKNRRRIVIEISERAFHSRVDTDLIVSELQNLRELGYLIALDDFGVESSNIQRLQSFPLDIVKLDKSLICDIVASDRQRTIVLSIAYMVESLGLTCIAEGVETEQQAQVLQQMGLVLHQGFFHALPSSPEEMAAQAPERNPKHKQAERPASSGRIPLEIETKSAVARQGRSETSKSALQSDVPPAGAAERECNRP